MEKKLYITPQSKIYTCSVRCLDNMSDTQGGRGDHDDAKSTSGMWDWMDEDDK